MTERNNHWMINAQETVGEGQDVDGGQILQNTVFAPDKQHVKASGPIVLANSLINFVVMGLTLKYSALVGSWRVEKLTGRQLYFLTIYVIKKRKRKISFLVHQIVGHNAKVKVRLFKILIKPVYEEDFRVTHPVDPSRKLYVYYDQTHFL